MIVAISLNGVSLWVVPSSDNRQLITATPDIVFAPLGHPK